MSGAGLGKLLVAVVKQGLQMGRRVHRWAGVSTDGQVCPQMGRCVHRWAGVSTDGQVCPQMGRCVHRWAGVSTVVVVIFTLQQTTFVERLALLMWRSKHGWFDEREACTKRLRRHWRHGRNTTISQNPGGGAGAGGCRIQGPGPAAPLCLWP